VGGLAVLSFTVSFRSPAVQQNELEYHLLLAKDLGYLLENEYEILDANLAEMKRMLVALTRKVGSEKKGG
jgi:hypothetical protein